MIERTTCLVALVLISVICSSTIAADVPPHPTETTLQSTQNEATTIPNHILALSASSKETDVNKATNELPPNDIKEDPVKTEPQANADQKKPSNDGEVNQSKARTMSPKEIEQLHALMKAMRINSKKNEYKKMARRRWRNQDVEESSREMPEVEEARPPRRKLSNQNLVEALSQIASDVGPMVDKKCYKAFMDGSERGPRVFGNMATTLDSRVMRMALIFFRAPISLTSGAVAYMNCLVENASARSFTTAVTLAKRVRGGLKFVNRVIDSFLVNDKQLAAEMAKEEARDYP